MKFLINIIRNLFTFEFLKRPSQRLTVHGKDIIKISATSYWWISSLPRCCRVSQTSIYNPDRGRNCINFFSFTVVWRHYQWGRRLEGWPTTAARLAGWRRVTRQVWFSTWWTGRTACLFHTVPVALTGAAQLRADGIFSCCYIVQCTQTTVMNYVTQGRHGQIMDEI